MDQSKTSTYRQQQKEDTKNLILAAAYQLFGDRGYHKTTMRALASHAGIGLGTIFKHFPDKPSLLAAAFQVDLHRVIANGFATLPPENIIRQLLHLVREIYSFYAKDVKLSRTLVKEAIFLEDDYGSQLDQQAVDFLGEISKLLEIAKVAGELPEHQDVPQGAIAFWSFYFTGLLLGLKQPEFLIDEQVMLVGSLLEEHFRAINEGG